MTKAIKHKKAALDVDFIGGEGTLTTEEEKALSAYFQQKKLVQKAADKKQGKTKALPTHSGQRPQPKPVNKQSS
jgi:outer membrane protein assembly factor BamE (lipoprotein component of BamABCDE complex)